jgi:hypothetical protein
MVYNPEALRKRTIELFELNQFKTQLAVLLSSN